MSLHKLATDAIQDAVNVANAKNVDLGLKQVDDLQVDLDEYLHGYRKEEKK